MESPGIELRQRSRKSLVGSGVWSLVLGLGLTACKSTAPTTVETPQEPEPYLAKIVDYGVFSHDGYFLQKRAILKYSHSNAQGGRKIERKRLSDAEVSEIIDKIRELDVAHWLPDYGTFENKDNGEGAWSDCGISAWQFHLVGDAGHPEIKSCGRSMYPADDDPKRIAASESSNRYHNLWEVFRDAFE